MCTRRLGGLDRVIVSEFCCGFFEELRLGVENGKHCTTFIYIVYISNLTTVDLL